MINIRTLKKLNNTDGLTLKNGKAIQYKSGWQVATEGKETKDIKQAMQFIKEYNGNCGVWYSDGIYYILSEQLWKLAELANRLAC